jgi:hypothetical protein
VLGDISPFGGFLEPWAMRGRRTCGAFARRPSAVRVAQTYHRGHERAEELRLAVRAARQAGAQVVLATATFGPGSSAHHDGRIAADMAVAAVAEAPAA